MSQIEIMREALELLAAQASGAVSSTSRSDCMAAVASDALRNAAQAGGSNHPDDFAVDHFANTMKAKMKASREKGRSGWNDPLMCTDGFLRRLLVKAVHKGDPVDVGNFAMMLFTRGARTLLPPSLDDIDKQIAIVDAQRHQRLERRLKDMPVEFDRRAGGDRRARIKD
jgi:hypothetical protein